MEIKKEKLQILFDTLTNYPAVSKEQVIHEFNKAFGKDFFKNNDTEEKDSSEEARASAELKDIKEKVRHWYEQDNDNRSILCIATEQLEKEEDSAIWVSLLGSDKNIVYGIAEVFSNEEYEKIPTLITKAVQLSIFGDAMNLIFDKEDE